MRVCKCEDKKTEYHLLNCGKYTCKTCEHESDSSGEYCNCCEENETQNNWSEAGWIKDKKIKLLTTALEIIIDFSKMGTSTEHSVLKVCKETLAKL